MNDRFENYFSSRDKVVDAVAARLEEIFTNRRFINAMADYEKARDLGVLDYSVKYIPTDDFNATIDVGDYNHFIMTFDIGGHNSEFLNHHLVVDSFFADFGERCINFTYQNGYTFDNDGNEQYISTSFAGPAYSTDGVRRDVYANAFNECRRDNTSVLRNLAESIVGDREYGAALVARLSDYTDDFAYNISERIDKCIEDDFERYDEFNNILGVEQETSNKKTRDLPEVDDFELEDEAICDYID